MDSGKRQRTVSDSIFPPSLIDQPESSAQKHMSGSLADPGSGGLCATQLRAMAPHPCVEQIEGG